MFPWSVSALVMQENGPEPIIVEIKESLRASDDLDHRLGELASTHRRNGLKAEKWWAGTKLLVMLSFPSDFTEQQARAAIEKLQQLPAVEKVVPVSAYNLHFRSGDFAREFGPTEGVPEVARRGFDAKRIGRPAFSPPNEADLALQPHAPNRLIVRWKDEHVWKGEATGFFQRVANLHRETGCRVVREERRSATHLSQMLHFDDATTLARKLKRYMDSGLVEYAQPDYIYKAAATTPSDPVFSQWPGPQWSLPRIQAPQAWDLTTGDPNVLIAVGDSGANVSHPEFAPNLWGGPHYNFYGGNYDVTDNFGHGSLVTSVIGAQGNNGLGMTGVAWDVSLMILKIMGPSGNFSPITTGPEAQEAQRDAFSWSVSQAITYAANSGATAINLSVIGTYFEDGPNGRTYFYDPAVEGAIAGSGMLIVAGAGNSNINNDYNNRNSPTSIPLDNVISVGATDQNDQRWAYSNIGRYRVDLGAPGVGIVGLKQSYNGNSTDYRIDSGTSFAAPHVTGAAALIKSRYPWENYFGIRDRILMGVDHVQNGDGSLRFENIFRTKGRLNVYNALQTRSMFRNISTRARVEDGHRVLVAGFVIGGSAGGPGLKVCIRGRGPTMPVADTLGNPVIELHKPDGSVETNDNWANDWNVGETYGYGLQPPHSNEATMIRSLPPGAYTVVLRDAGTDFGVGLFEMFELEGNTNERSRLVNLSTRCFVGTGDDQAVAGVMVGEFNYTGLPKPDRRVLILGKGPSLAAFGLPGTLPNPQLSVPTLGLVNDNWQTIDNNSGSGDALEEELNYAGFAPAQPAESVLWPTLSAASSHTAILSDANGASGIGIIEFYEY